VSQDFHAVAILLIGEVIGRITNESLAMHFAAIHWQRGTSETILAFAQHWSRSFSGLALVKTVRNQCPGIGINIPVVSF
jgi:hypothetical protein